MKTETFGLIGFPLSHTLSPFIHKALFALSEKKCSYNVYEIPPEKLENEFQHGDTYTKVTVEFDEPTYMTLLQRYRELFEKRKGTEEDDDFDFLNNEADMPKEDDEKYIDEDIDNMVDEDEKIDILVDDDKEGEE